MSPNTENPAGSPCRDALRDIYLDAVQDDAGPSAQSSERILAHARLPAQRANQIAERRLEASAAAKDAANDGFWLRHAVAGVAAIGLVGWLLVQHMAQWDGRGQAETAESAPGAIAHKPAPTALEESAGAEPAADAAHSKPSVSAAAARADAARSRLAAPLPESPAPAHSVNRPGNTNAAGLERTAPKAAEMVGDAKQARQAEPLPLCPEEQALHSAARSGDLTSSASGASAPLSAQTPADSKVNSGSEPPATACRPATKAPAKAGDAVPAEPLHKP